jgi:hypothetical protein
MAGSAIAGQPSPNAPMANVVTGRFATKRRMAFDSGETRVIAVPLVIAYSR